LDSGADRAPLSGAERHCPSLLVGLGNPGKRYENTRHNLGFQVIDAVADFVGKGGLDHTGRFSVYASISWRGRELILAKPITYMNRSGMAVEELLAMGGMEPKDLLVICDDLALPLGMVRLRRRGSSGGNQGLASIIQTAGCEDFARLRIGIGESEGDAVDHVLSQFPADQVQLVKETTTRARDAALWAFEHGLESAMSQFNQRVKDPGDEGSEPG